MSSVHTEALLSLYCGPGVELGLVGNVSGLLGTVVIVTLLPVYEGKLGL
jgi:hypothetical protein